MAVEIPKESKVYTTVYETFKGVDFTNDASNVFYRRSPTGKNMLPDIDGRPYKRSGWKVEVPESRFRELYESMTQTTTDVKIVPDRTYYFELDGKDYLMAFNNLGLFSYSEDGLKMIATAANIDSKRAFFFEGGGDAGFYFFRGHALCKYTGGDGFYSRVPKTPVFLIGCDPNGAGTVYEPINMLTRKRTVQYLCDGETARFVVPGGMNDTNPIVETRDASGNWESQTTGWEKDSSAAILFETAPSVVVEGEDNLRITYEPDDNGQTETDPNVLTGWKTVSVTKTTTRVETGKTKKAEKTSTSITWDATSANFTLKNLLRNADGTPAYTVQCRNSAGTDWQDADASYTNSSADAYAGTATVKGKKALFNSNVHTYSTKTTSNTTSWVKSGSTYKRTSTTKETKTYRIRVKYDRWVYTSSDTSTDSAINAFFGTTRAMVFGNGIINQVFLTASTSQDFNTRVWYSAATDPSYFPDTNYIEVGSTDKPIMGLIRVGEYLGIIKQGSGTETSVYLAYPTSFENETTYAVKQSVNGIGAIANGAFNILNDEPLFLSAEGVMGIEPSEDESRKIRNRSHYVNKRLCAENNLSSAISFVHEGMYWLAVNGHCYVLDGSQKSSWANTKTNLQYECYYLENVPAQCFAKMGGQLWFTDFDGNLCRFKDEADEIQYSDEYSADAENVITASIAPTDGVYQKSALSGVEIKTDTLIEDYWDADVREDLYTNGASFEFESDYTSIDNVCIVLYTEYSGESIEQPVAYTVSSGQINITAGQGEIEALPTRGGHEVVYDTYGIYVTYVSGEPIEVNVGDIIKTPSTFYTVVEVGEETVTVQQGVPIEAVWGTIADDDGAPHYFKNLQKKGCMVSLLPSSDSGVEVWLQADNKDPVKIGETDAKNYDLPFDFYIKKKVKKYKRLQIICKNNTIGDSFGVDQIIKSYTFGNYSKNRG